MKKKKDSKIRLKHDTIIKFDEINYWDLVSSAKEQLVPFCKRLSCSIINSFDVRKWKGDKVKERALKG